MSLFLSWEWDQWVHFDFGVGVGSSGISKIDQGTTILIKQLTKNNWMLIAETRLVLLGVKIICGNNHNIVSVFSVDFITVQKI